jgi:thiamine biosynthesis lipoprotein
VSASIIADDCTTADAIATAVMVRGLEKGLELIESLDGIEGYMIGIDTKGGFKSIWSKSFPINL